MVDLFLGHAGAFCCAEGVFLFLAPLVDEMDVLGVAGWFILVLERYKEGERRERLTYESAHPAGCGQLVSITTTADRREGKQTQSDDHISSAHH